MKKIANQIFEYAVLFVLLSVLVFSLKFWYDFMTWKVSDIRVIQVHQTLPTIPLNR